MVQTKAKVISNAEVVPRYFKATLEAPAIAKEVMPGQFLHIKVKSGWDPLLRRPFSAHRIRGSSVEILYRVAGRGTAILSEVKEGEVLDCLGPLGNGFRLQLPLTSNQLPEKDKKIILVAGGIGVAPLLALAEELSDLKFQICVMIGAKTKELILCEREFNNLNVDVQVATEDGSYGFKGMITDLLEKLLVTGYSGYPPKAGRVTTIYACGPKPMLKKVAEISKPKGIPCQASLEENMGCGLGACLGCVVKTSEGYKRVCKDGPIFELAHIEWSNEDTT